MSGPFGYYQQDDPFAMYQAAMSQRMGGGRNRRFDEYYRCYPTAMMPGPERLDANYGGKVFLPASALEKLTRLHISYPMLFELINGAKDKQTHAGVLEFTAEEGKIYLPQWLMETLLLEIGDLLQIKSTDLPPGTFIKLQPQSPAFLDISDPKAVLENAFRNFSCLTVGDIFTFSYNDSEYKIAVLEIKPDGGKQAICTMETDLSVDFAAPVGYVEPDRKPSVSKGSGQKNGAPASGHIHQQGTMAQRINYDAIKPNATAAAAGAAAVASHFASGGHRLGSSRKPSAAATPVTVTPPNGLAAPSPLRKGNGPQPLRLPPGQLFFGWDIVPLRKDSEKKEQEEQANRPKFQGMGQTLRGKKVEASTEAEAASEPEMAADGERGQGRTLRDSK